MGPTLVRRMGGDLLITDLVERSPLQALGSEVVDAPMEIYQREYLIAGDTSKNACVSWL